ncbi:D-2-hydroxyacid dehydrogenase family protein [Ramlibacter sp. AW1]|uniref:D-2-hydroxyacid dehydrogenase family protein n=1 Tax=Ramlibacter aurantiacus TaxID=2801330 RepID=A0A936ZX05_9BURK|nr:D-2-hydroxyacid dehydrogenase family protein [Ramlibacter aurantiacus]MBL0422655.1 D-2-hydroxyacid dehydrogenase family protein [Ramlibacter aurantiacus]
MSGALLPRVAVLDDYLHVARECADWSVLEGLCEVDFLHRQLQVPDEAAQVLAPYDALCHLRERTPMPRSLIERLPRLKFMTVTGKAHRTLDLAAATERGIVVSHVSAQEMPSNATPEMTWALILAAARHVAYEDRMVRAGRWQNTLGLLLEGRTLGLLGLGRVGQKVAAIGRAFGMRVIAWSPNLTAEAAAVHGVVRVDKEALFRDSDVLSVHLVLSERSRGVVGRAELALMKRSALLVNTSRGPIVDEAALIDALASGRLGGAGLDVFEQEPLPADSPLCRLDNVVLTPHLGYATRDTFEGFYRSTVEGLLEWLQGQGGSARAIHGRLHP